MFRSHFWQLRCLQKLPFLATFMQCQIFFPILAFNKIAKIGRTCLLKVAKNGNFRCYYRFAIIGNICNSSKSSQMTNALPYIPSGSIGKDSLHTTIFDNFLSGNILPILATFPLQFVSRHFWQLSPSSFWQVSSVTKIGKSYQLPKLANVVIFQNWQLLSVAKIGKCYRLPNLASVVDCQIWQILSIAKIGKYHQLPKLANVVIFQNWQMLSVAKIGKCCQLPKLANFEDIKVAKIGKYYHQLPNLANVGCQNWQILKTPKLPKLAFEHTWSMRPQKPPPCN